MTAWIVIGAVLLGILGLLFLPIHLQVTANNLSVHARLSVLGIRKRLYPFPQKKNKAHKKKKTKNKETKIETGTATKKRRLGHFRELRGLIASILIRMPQTFSLKIKRFTLRVASDDPAKTALLYGGACSSVSFFLEWLDRHLCTVRPIRSSSLRVYADFDSDESSLDADLQLSTSLRRLLSLAVTVFLPYFLKRLSKKSKKSSKQRKDSSNVRRQKQAQRAD